MEPASSANHLAKHARLHQVSALVALTIYYCSEAPAFNTALKSGLQTLEYANGSASLKVYSVLKLSRKTKLETAVFL